MNVITILQVIYFLDASYHTNLWLQKIRMRIKNEEFDCNNEDKIIICMRYDLLSVMIMHKIRHKPSINKHFFTKY